MAVKDRRDFLKRSAGVAGALGVPLLAGCWADEVSMPTDLYDVVIVGAGAAGSIVATRLAQASGGRKRILVIEAGGPTQAVVGGTAFPPWTPPGRRDLTIFDVPGNYSQLSWTPLAAPYQLTETAFTYQGIGLGGNSVFNGMLVQTNPPRLFERHWPRGWQWEDLAPHYERIRARVPVSNTPSTDHQPYNAGPAQIVHPLYAQQGWIETDTSHPFAAEGAYSRPYVATANGQRAGPVSAYLAQVAPAGVPIPGLEILTYAKVERLEFDSGGRATGVHYRKRSGLDQHDPGTEGRVRVRDGGLVILAAGALISPRLLLLSGVGPRGREAEIFPGQQRPAFAIDNPDLGTGLFDHVLTMVTFDYSGPVPYTAYDYADYAANAADIARYLANGSGPYAQFQPVSILNYRAGVDTPNVEIFLNPNGAGRRGGPYWGPRSFSAFAMLLDAKSRSTLRIGAGNEVLHPPIYLPDTPEGAADTTPMAQAVFDMIQLFARDPALRIAFGPGSASHPHLDPNSLDDVRRYVTGPSPVDDVHFNRLVTNHWGGTAPLKDGPGGTDPATLLVRGTRNVAVVDASLLPSPVAAHPVGTIMAVADRASDLLVARWA